MRATWIKNAHLIVGVISFAVFLLTGLYMLINFPNLYGENELVRMMYRANHIYLLFSAFMNVLLGFFLVIWANKISRYLQYISSVCLCILPFVFAAAFFVEPALGNFDRLISYLAIVGTAVTMGLLFLAFMIEQLTQTSVDTGEQHG